MRGAGVSGCCAPDSALCFHYVLFACLSLPAPACCYLSLPACLPDFWTPIATNEPFRVVLSYMRDRWVCGRTVCGDGGGCVV